MPITERTLKKWRRIALTIDKNLDRNDRAYDTVKTLTTYILRMTQELLDQHLLRKVVK